MRNIKGYIISKIFNLFLAIEAVMANKIRSVLTALGIIFGVAAVIAMMAIGSGAQEEILNQIKLVGVNNIVIQPIIIEESDEINIKKISPGLTLSDANAVRVELPTVGIISPEIVLEKVAVRGGKSKPVKLVGVELGYFQLYSFEILKGEMFNEQHLLEGDPVCIIGKSIETKFFSKTDPIGQMIKCGNIWLKVIGVLSEKNVTQSAISNLGIRDYNMDIYAPIKTVLLRYRNRSLVTSAMLKGNQEMDMDEDEQQNNKEPIDKNYHQLDKLVVQVLESEYIGSTTEIISRLLKRKHAGVVDYEITIPEMLLKQQQKTKDIFNIVLGAIAGISLIVGGIGIMNIMLASVLERIKEIGLRMSIGATKEDIILQFLFEAIFISVSGGIIGVILGVIMAKLIMQFTGILTIVSFSSILLSFSVAASVGLIFGIMPARRAAMQDPINSLRYE